MNTGKLINIILYYKNTHVKVHAKSSNEYENSENVPVKIMRRCDQLQRWNAISVVIFVILF